MPGFLDKLLGRRKAAPPPQPAAPPPPDPRDDEPIVCYDDFGRTIHIKRSAWRTDVLPKQLAKSWNDAEALAADVVMALRDGFATDIVDAARRLQDIDPNRERGASLHAMVLLECNDLEGALRVLTPAIAELPQSAVLLSDLALVHSRRGDRALTHQYAWRALKLDPNGQNALALFVSTSDDPDAAQRRAYALPGSWRAGLWVALDHLRLGDLASAVAIYEQLLPRFAHQPELLVNMSGDLGTHGHFAEAARLVLPHYEPAAGELEAGFNLLQVFLELRDRTRGEELLHRMQLVAQPPDRERLLWYSSQFIELEVAVPMPAPVADVAFEMLQLERPIWTYGAGDIAWLLPKKAPDARRVAILSFANVTSREWLRKGEALVGREDDLGRATRAMPLHLADTLRFRTGVQPVLYMPVVSDGGMVVMNEPATYETLEAMPESESHTITGSISVTGEDELELHVELWERGTPKPVARFDERGPLDALHVMYARTERELLRFLHETNVAAPHPADPRFLIADEHLQRYLVTIGQIYALAIARMKNAHGLYGERNIHHWVLTSAVALPESSLLKIATVTALANSRRRGSKVYLEIQNETLKLFARVTRDDPAYLITPALFRLFELDAQFEKRRNELLGGASEDYVKWLADLETLFE